jgi:hypothetical protein
MVNRIHQQLIPVAVKAYDETASPGVVKLGNTVGQFVTKRS